MAIKVGQQVENFTLKDQDENQVSLDDFKGKKVLLSFHPLAFTDVCRTQMEQLEENYQVFEENNTVPLGISVDAFPTKKAWADDMGLKKLRLLADFWPHGELAMKLENFVEKHGFSGRANFLLDEDGKVSWVKVYGLTELPDINEVLEVVKGE